MLKIRDNVDLNILKKYGFTKKCTRYSFGYNYEMWEYNDDNGTLYVVNPERKIIITQKDEFCINPTTLYKMIIDEIVEIDENYY